MKRDRKSILFVGHEAYRTGASLLLLNLIRWIFIHRDIKLYLLLMDGGPLIEEYKKYAEVLVLSKKKSVYSYVQNFRFRLFLKKMKDDLVYFNTVASLKLYERYKLQFSPFRKILHVHEMPFSITELAGTNLNIEDFHSVLVVNSRIQDFFIKPNVLVPKISLVTEYIDLKGFDSNNNKSNITLGKKIVLGVGVASWRKGFDLFLQTAAISFKKFPGQFKFVWVGPISKQDRERAEYDSNLLGLNNSFELVGETDDVYSYFQRADLLFLSSREDPFPLVMLEAAVFNLPVIYFQGTGGAEEFFDYKPFEVQYGDCQEASERIHSVLGDLSKHQIPLDQFRRKALECDIEKVIPKILKEIGID